MKQAEETDLASAFPPGSLIDAKYFEDDQFYPAQVVGVTETGYIVRFDGYNNEEEVAPDAIRFRETKQGEEEKPKKKRKAESEGRRNIENESLAVVFKPLSFCLSKFRN